MDYNHYWPHSGLDYIAPAAELTARTPELCEELLIRITRGELAIYRKVLKMAGPGSIKTYEQLYAYFAEHPNEYRMTKFSSVMTQVIRIGPSGNPLTEIRTSPEEHGQLCVHYFYGVEVQRPQVYLPGPVIDDVCNHLGLPKDIFEYYTTE